MSMDAVLIAGPTASGKSAAALALAEQIRGALINTDSMQVYCEARILTARPDDAALARAPHFLFGHVGVNEPYSVARYQSDATAARERVRASGKVPIFVGGTGLYFAALTGGLADVPPVPESVRKSVRSRREEVGAERFFDELAARDSLSVAHLRASDTQRVLRAAEVLEATGRALSDWQKNRGAAPLSGLRLICFVLSPPRPELHTRIEQRFDHMVAAGALHEARHLKRLAPAMSASKILGLRQLWAALDGRLTLDAAVLSAKTATRQYAKRQLTWFRHRMADWLWIEETDMREVVARMLQNL
jgi:tRNA dimethylallyltransferase